MIVLIALVHLVLALRVITFPGYSDEEITQGVSARLWRERTLDTNWRHVPQVAENYPGDQFNFSSAILAAQPIALAASAVSNGRYAPFDLPPLRFASVVFTLSAFVFFFLAFRSVLGLRTAVIAFVLTALSTQLFLDSLYARPEAFVLFCFAFALYACCRPDTEAKARIAWLVAAGISCGLLIAAKFSLFFTVCHIVLILLALDAEGSSWRAVRPGRQLSCLVAGAAFGFCIGVPAAVADPMAFFRGVAALSNQYGSPHPPFGLPFSPVWDRFQFALNQIVATNGVPQLVLAALGATLWFRSRPLLAGAFALPAFAFILFFSIRPVYFERNFSLYLPLLSALTGYGIDQIIRSLRATKYVVWSAGLALLLLVAIEPARTYIRVVLSVVPEQVQRWEALFGRETALSASLGLPIASTPYITVEHVPAFAKQALQAPPRVYRLIDLGDSYSARAAALLVASHGWRIVDEEPSVVADMHQPLLQLYFARAYRYLVPPHAPLTQGREFLGAAGLCPQPSLALPAEGGVLGGLPTGLGPPNSVRVVRGTWVGSDAWVGQIELGPFLPTPGSFVQVLTGPSIENISAVMKEAGSDRILAKLPLMPLGEWVAWRLPESSVPIQIYVTDSGSGWGQWIAIGLIPLTEPGIRGCTPLPEPN